MARFCQNCGSPLNEGTNFCPGCGMPVQQNAAPQAPPQTPPPAVPAGAYFAPAYAGNGAVRQGIPYPGFSDRVNHPEIIAAVKKNRKSAAIFSFFLIPLPMIGFIAYSMISGKMELSDALLYGGIVSGVFLLFALFGAIRSRARSSYEATVIDKNTRRAYRRNSSDDRSYYTEYITVVRTADGGKKKIVEREGAQIRAWDYLQPGERFRYHPQFNFPYELYDKSRAPYIACVSCVTKNTVDADRCQKCGLPLLK